MKLSVAQLRRIIKEEVSRMLVEEQGQGFPGAVETFLKKAKNRESIEDGEKLKNSITAINDFKITGETDLIEEELETIENTLINARFFINAELQDLFEMGVGGTPRYDNLKSFLNTELKNMILEYKTYLEDLKRQFPDLNHKSFPTL